MITFQITYVVFLMIFTYMVVVETELKPAWACLYSVVYMGSLACEKIRAFVSSGPFDIRYDTLLFLLLCSRF
jgi:hypothetical protein